MCGLSGCAGGLAVSDEKVAKTLLMFNEWRGVDSTGIASVKRNNNHEITLAKELGPPAWLFDTKRFDKVFYGVGHSVFINHNRSRTLGDVTRANAHPFLVNEELVGAHNGTLDMSNKNRLKDSHTFRTDSEAIFNDIYHNGVVHTVSQLDKDAAYALTWYDKRDNTMNFVRNEKRPLHYAYSKGRKAIYWSSEVMDLKHALFRNNVDYDDKIYLLTENLWLKYALPESENLKLPEAVRTKLKNYEYKYSRSGGNGHGGTFFPTGKSWQEKERERKAKEALVAMGLKSPTSETTGTPISSGGTNKDTTKTGTPTEGLTRGSTEELEDDLPSPQYYGGNPSDYDDKVWMGPLVGWVGKDTEAGRARLKEIEDKKKVIIYRKPQVSEYAKKAVERARKACGLDPPEVHNDDKALDVICQAGIVDPPETLNVTEEEDSVVSGGASSPVTFQPESGSSGVRTTAERINGTLTASDVFKKRQWDEAVKAGLVPEKSSLLVPFRQFSNLRVWRNPTNGHWTYLEWNETRKQWEKHDDDCNHPRNMPYSILDPEAGGDHRWIHEGKKKKGNKKIFFKGFNGYKLDMDKFNNVCREGCIDCGRVSEWGNPVVFLTKEHDYACEYCSLTPGFVDGLIKLGKQKEGIKAA